MDGWSEHEQEMEMDVCRDKRVRYTVISLLVLSDLSVVAEERGSISVQPATITQPQLLYLWLQVLHTVDQQHLNTDYNNVALL